MPEEFPRFRRRHHQRCGSAARKFAFNERAIARVRDGICGDALRHVRRTRPLARITVIEDDWKSALYRLIWNIEIFKASFHDRALHDPKKKKKDTENDRRIVRATIIARFLPQQFHLPT